MAAEARFGSLDRFKLLAGMLVVANHTSPLTTYSPFADFLLSGLLSRVAVPFFFMASGFFFFRSLPRKPSRWAALKQFMSRIGFLYAVGILLYLPLNVYSGDFNSSRNFGSYVSGLFFNGTFYHLWYLPALMIGVGIVFGLKAALPGKAVIGIAAGLYAIGLLGDSYFGLTASVSPALAAVFNSSFHWSDYTRNGIWFAPLFIAMGAGAAQRSLPPASAPKLAVAFLFFLALTLIEGIWLKQADFARLGAMYVFLVPAMYSLFHLLLRLGGKKSLLLRQLSTWIYVVHPWMIVAVRGTAKLLGLQALLIGNSLIHFIAVAATSAALSLGGVIMLTKLKSTTAARSRAWAEIDLANLDHNVKELQRILPSGTALMAVVKANAYGHGAAPVAERLYSAGISSFAVAEIDEGIALRRQGIQGEILVLGYTPSDRLDELLHADLAQTVVSAEDAERLQAFGKRINVHIKIDTGMNRLGEPFGHTEKILSMYRHSHLHVIGTFSHLACADSPDEEDRAFTRLQYERLLEVAAKIRSAGHDPGRLHIQNSSGILNGFGWSFDTARPGLALYGLNSAPEGRIPADIELRPVLSLKASVTRVSRVECGEAVGYNRGFTASRATVLATLSIGYADGIPRRLAETGGSVLLHGKRAPIVGRISMDQMTVDVTEIEGVRQGDAATLIGRDGAEAIAAEEVAASAGTIVNEVLSRLGPRLQRIYLS